MTKIKKQHTSQEQRQTIIALRKQGNNSKRISEITGVNQKTIESIKSENKKVKYGELEDQIKQYVINQLEENKEFRHQTNEKRQKSIIRKIVKIQLNYTTSQYKKLIGEKRKDFQRRRIMVKLVDQIFIQSPKNLKINQQNSIINSYQLNIQQITDPIPIQQDLYQSEQNNNNSFNFSIISLDDSLSEQSQHNHDQSQQNTKKIEQKLQKFEEYSQYQDWYYGTLDLQQIS